MQTSYVSSLALRNAPRNDLIRFQSELTERTRELTTGRHADVGLTLGSGAGRNVSHRVDRSTLEALLVSNASAASRLEIVQTALTDVQTLTSDMLATLVALPPGPTAGRTAAVEATAGIARLADLLNVSDGRSYLFSGINTGVAPLTRWEAGPQAAVEAAFLARFGVAVDSPGAAAITAADMEDFLTNDLPPLFADPAWGTTWSSASDTNMTSRIAPQERVQTSTNANEQAFREVAMGLAMVAGLGIGSLGEAARAAVVNAARTTIGEAITGVVELKTVLGFSEQAIDKASHRMSLAEDLFERAIGEAEGTDPAEAKTRIDLLTAQIEMSYAMTGQLARLNILNYA